MALNPPKDLLTPTTSWGFFYFKNFLKIFQNFSTWSGEVPVVNYGLHTYAIENIFTEYVQKIVDGADINKTLEDAQKQIEASI